VWVCFELTKNPIGFWCPETFSFLGLDAQDCIHPHPEGCGFLHQQS